MRASSVALSVCDVRLQIGNAELRPGPEGTAEIVIASPDLDLRIQASPEDLADALAALGVILPDRCRQRQSPTR